jgi:hypothetical protein
MFGGGVWGRGWRTMSSKHGTIWRDLGGDALILSSGYLYFFRLLYGVVSRSVLRKNTAYFHTHKKTLTPLPFSLPRSVLAS